MIKKVVKWQSISSIITFSLSLLQVGILARILSLTDFGLVAIVMVVINISQVLSDLGMANYLVYKQKSTALLNSTVFWVCLISGVSLLLLLCLIAPLISSLYSKPEISYLLPMAGLGFIPISLSSQLQSRYICAFRLNELAKFDIMSKLIGTISAIFAAYSGMGAVSIIISGLSASVMKCIFVWYFSDSEWKPKFQFSFKEAKNALGYGVYQIGSQVINQFRGNLDTLLLGLYIDKSQLGAYSLAKQLIQKPAAFILPVVQKICLPLFASLQLDGQKLKTNIVLSHNYVAILIIFPYALMCYLHKDITTLMYGDGKLEVAEFVIPLALFWMFRTVGGALVGPLTQGIGKTNVDFYWNLSVLGLFSSLCVWLAPLGAYTLAWGIAILQGILMHFVYVVFFRKIVNLEYKSFINPIMLYSTLSVVAIGISSLLFSSFDVYLGFFYIIVISSLSSTILFYLLCYHFGNDSINLPNPYSIFNLQIR